MHRIMVKKINYSTVRVNVRVKVKHKRATMGIGYRLHMGIGYTKSRTNIRNLARSNLDIVL